MKKRLFAILLVLCMAAALFAGCSNGGKTSPSPSNSASANPTNSGTQPTASTAPEADKYGGTLAIYGGTSTADTFYFPKFTRSSMQYAPACETLGKMDVDGIVTGFLVESFEVDTNALTLTMKCREGIKFSDGSDFNAEALTWEINECIKEGNAAVVASATEAIAKDDMTVVVSFKEFANNWEEVYCQFIVISKATYDEKGAEYMASMPVGTGPFVCKSMVKNVEVKFERNENYWQEGLPYLDGINYICMSTDTLLSAMVNNEVQVVTSSDGSYIDQLVSYCGDKIKNITGNEAQMCGYTYFTVNTLDEASPFKDVLVRQACFYALDNDAMAKTLGGSIAYGATQNVAKGSYGWLEDNELYSNYKYDVAKAKELLTQAGYPNGFDCTIMARSSNEKQSVALQSFLKAAGINVDIEMVENTVFTERTSKNGTCDIAILTAGPRSQNWTSSWEKHLSAKRSRFVTVQATFDDFDKLFNETKAAVSHEDLVKTQKAVNYWLNENLPQIPMYFSTMTTYCANNLEDSNMGGQWYHWTPETAFFAK